MQTKKHNQTDKIIPSACILFTDELNQMLLEFSIKLNTVRSQANTFTFCKKHILIHKLWFWEKQLRNFIEQLMYSNNFNLDSEKLKINNVNAIVEQYLVDNYLACPCFTDFFFSFHDPLTQSTLNLINERISTTLGQIEFTKAIDSKKQQLIDLLHYVMQKLLDLVDITLIELKSFNMSCKNIQGEIAELCKRILQRNPKLTGIITACDVVSPLNIIALTIVPEYFQEVGLFRRILSNLSKIKNPTYTLLLMDYNYLCKQSDSFKWENTLFEQIQQYVYKVYFINAKCVDFGTEYSQIEPYIIKNDTQLNELLIWWRSRMQGHLAVNTYYDCAKNMVVHEIV